MNPALAKALGKLGGVLGSSLLLALSGLLSKILEPLLKWLMFTSMKLLIKVLPHGDFERTVISLYKELRSAYQEDKK